MNPIADALTSLASSIANKGLDLDPATQARLTQLEGQILALEISPPSLALWISVTGGHLDVLAQEPGEPQVRVTASTVALLSAISGTGQWQQNTGISVEGDLVLFAGFVELLRQFRPDFAVPASKLMGQQTAQSLIGSIELAAAGLRSAAEGVGATIKTQVQQRYGGQDQVAALEREIDELRHQVQQLQARIDDQEQPP